MSVTGAMMCDLVDTSPTLGSGRRLVDRLPPSLVCVRHLQVTAEQKRKRSNLEPCGYSDVVRTCSDTMVGLRLDGRHEPGDFCEEDVQLAVRRRQCRQK